MLIDHGIKHGGKAGGTGLMGEIKTSFKALRRLLGEPLASDGYKVSTEWVLTFREQTFTIYDYKETDLYDGGLPSVEEFRAQPSYAWHIGAAYKKDVEAFIAALQAALAEVSDGL